MTREDIIRMAREAGAMFDHMTWVERDLAPVFERFAALVAEHARNRTWTQAHWTEYERSIAAVEREACAKLCDEIAIDMWKLYKGRPPYKGDEEGRASDFTQGRSAGADDCADAIRRRTDAA
jgi:hypothetical protein